MSCYDLSRSHFDLGYDLYPISPSAVVSDDVWIQFGLSELDDLPCLVTESLKQLPAENHLQQKTFAGTGIGINRLNKIDCILRGRGRIPKSTAVSMRLHTHLLNCERVKPNEEKLNQQVSILLGLFYVFF